MRTQDVIADFVISTKPAMARYLAGFDDTNHTRQAPNLPNHVAWNLGHCALTMHRVCEKFDGAGPPESDFVVGAMTGDARRFGTESVCFGSVPIGDASAYPTLARCVAIFDAAADRLAACVRVASDEKLREEIPWGPARLPLFLAAMRMGTHNGMHIGQIADLRRALGFKSIFA
jgi:hypothetical protein